MLNDTEKARGEYYFDKAERETHSSSNRHFHSSFEIYYLKAGRCNYFINDRSYEIKAGELVLIPEGAIHKTNYPMREPHTRYLINCTRDFIPPSLLSLTEKIIRIEEKSGIVSRAEDIFNRIEEEYEREDEFRTDALRALTHELLFFIVRNMSSAESEASSKDFASRAAEYLEEHFHEDITLSSVARVFAVSPEHLSRRFKEKTGLGFSQYLNLLRLRAAEYMLKNEPGRSILEISYACGFNDSNYFSNKFKKAYGYPPSRAR